LNLFFGSFFNVSRKIKILAINIRVEANIGIAPLVVSPLKPDILKDSKNKIAEKIIKITEKTFSPGRSFLDLFIEIVYGQPFELAI
jgi:hypothetical protein